MSWLSRADLGSVVASAMRAPSMHNSQPWRFRWSPEAVELWMDPERRLPVADASGWAGRLSCGAALFNLRLAMAVRGTPVVVTILPEARTPDLIARVVPGPQRAALPWEARLFRAIERRYSNRTPFADVPVPVAVRADLLTAARQEQCWLDLLLGPAAVEATAGLVRAADDLLARDEVYQAELVSWARADPSAMDGVAVSAAGPAVLAGELLPRRVFGDHPARPRDFEREPLIAVLGGAGDSARDEIQVGQGLQRVLLTATDLGLAASMFSQPIEVAAVREQLRLALRRYAAPQMLLRFGYAGPAPGRSGRRPAAEVMVEHPDVVD